MKRISELSRVQLNALTTFRRETIMFPQFDEVFRQVSDSIELYQRTGLAAHHILHGHSGCGKSTLCHLLLSEHPRFVVPERDVVPLLYTAVPALATISSVNEALLAELGDPFPTKGTNSAKTNRLITLIEGCRVCMVILDEVQHVHDRGQSPTIYKVADWIKNLLDLSGRPFLLTGLPRVVGLLRTNEQLRRRFGSELILDRMILNNDEAATEFASLVASLLEVLPVPSALDLKDEETVERLYYASDGRVGYLVSLLHGGLLLAYLLEIDRIDCNLLERAFIEQIWNGGIGKLNPFHSEFCFRRLDMLGEPFHSGQAGNLGRGGHGKGAHA